VIPIPRLSKSVPAPWPGPTLVYIASRVPHSTPSVFVRFLNPSGFLRGGGDPPFFRAAPPESNKTVLHVLSDSFKTGFVFLSCRFYLAGII